MSRDPHEVAETVGLVTTSTDRLTAALAERLEIGVNDLRALYVVHAGSQPSAKTIGTVLGITSGSTTPLVDRLVARSFLRRIEHPTDRRSSLLELTPAGRHAVAWMADHFDRALTAALGDLADDEVERFHALLLRVHAALDEHHPD